MHLKLTKLFGKHGRRAKVHLSVLQYEELEPRILFSADAAPSLEATVIDDPVMAAHVADEIQGTPSTESIADEQASAVENRTELVIVSDNVPDYEQLINDLQSDDNRIIAVAVIDADGDGIAQVSDILAGHQDLSAVHFITHGADGRIQLGNQWLDSTTLEANRDTVAAWGNALTESGDILFYGCNIAADGDGQTLLASIAAITGSDVAASDDTTGHADAGGDWQLEFEAGAIETGTAVPETTQDTWTGTLVGTEAPTDIVLDVTADVTVANPGFENDVLNPWPTEPYNSTTIDSWANTGAGTGIWYADAYSYTDLAPEGNNVAYINAGAEGTISQTLAATFQADTSYSLSVMVGDELYAGDATGWEIRLYAGTQLLGSIDSTDFNPGDDSFIDATLTLDSATLSAHSAYYGEALTIELYDSGTSENVHFDDVRLTATADITVSENASNGTVVTAVASVTDPDVGDSHTFSLTDDAGGRFAIDSSTGEITVADGSLLDYETATSHDITVRVTDSELNTYDEVFTIHLTDVNEVPVAVDDAVSTDEDTPFSSTIDLDANDTDVDGDSLSVVPGTFATTQGGAIVIAADGSYTYTPPANFNGTDTVGYTVTDGSLTDTGTLTITVNAVNDAPTISSAAEISANENSTAIATIVAGDVEGDTLTYTMIGGPDQSKFNLDSATGELTFSSAPDYETPTDNDLNNIYEVTVQVTDGNGGSVNQSIDVTVSNLNDNAPVAVDDAVSTDEDTPFSSSIDLDANDTDVDGDSLTVVAGTFATAQGGSIVIAADGSYTYTPPADFNGTDTVDYTVTDGSLTDTGTLTITVNAVNDAPVAVDDAVSTDEDTQFSSSIDLDANDTDVDGDSLTVVAGTFATAQGGSIVIAADGSYTYTPPADFNGTDTVDYTVTDGSLTDTGTLTITVNAVNDAPVAVDDAVSTNEDTPFSSSIDLDANDTDVDGDSLTVVAGTFATAQGGSIVIAADGSYTYTPPADFNGTDTVDYTVTDGSLTDTGTLTITVNAINDAPVFLGSTIVTNGTFDTGLGDWTTSGNVDWYASGQMARFGQIGGPNGVISQTITTIPGETYIIRFDWRDGSETQAQQIQVEAVGTTTLLTAVADTGVENKTPVRFTYAFVADSTATTLAFTDLSASHTGVRGYLDTIVVARPASTGPVVAYTENQGEATIFPDVEFGDLDDTAIESATLQISGNYVDSEDLLNFVNQNGITGSWDSASGTLTLTGTAILRDYQTALQSVTYENTSDNPDTSARTVTLVINDGSDDSVALPCTINVTAINDAPVAVDDAVSTDEDTPFSSSIDLDANDTDVDGDSLSVVAGTFATAQGGSIVIAADGSYTYTPGANFNGTDTVDYTVTDGSLTDTGTLTITVNAVNDAPVLTAYAPVYDTSEDAAPFSTTVATMISSNNITDVDDTLKGIAVFGLSGSGGTVEYSTDGGSNWLSVGSVSALNALLLRSEDLLRFTPSTENGGTMLFDYRAWDQSDGNSAGDYVDAGSSGGSTAFSSTSDQATINVTSVNDAPVAVDDAASTNEDTPFSSTIDLDANDIDVDGDSLTVVAGTFATAQGGSIVMAADGSYTYTPPANFNGTDTVDYTVTDGSLTDTGTLTTTVNAVNDAPVAVDDAVSTDEDTPLSSSIDLDANDTDVDGDSLTVVAGTFTTAQGGSIVMAADGSYTYTPPANFNGTDTVDYTVTDGSLTDTGPLTITVNAVNDAPGVTAVDLGSMAEDGTLTITQAGLLTGSSDVDGDTLSVINLTLASDSGSLTDNGDGTWTFTPAANVSGAVSFDFDISDGATTTANSATLTITAVNDAPVAVDDTATTKDEPDDAPSDAVVVSPPRVPGGQTDLERPEIDDELLFPDDDYFMQGDSGTMETQPEATGNQQTQEPRDIIFLTDDNDDTSGNEPREVVHTITYDKNDLYKEIAAIKYSNYNPKIMNHRPTEETIDLEGMNFAENDAKPLVVQADYNRLREQIDENFQSEQDAIDVRMKIVTVSITTFTVGIVSYLLRAGSLLAGMISTLPLWRGFDPIAVFSGKRKKKPLPDKPVDRMEAQPETLFDRDGQ